MDVVVGGLFSIGVFMVIFVPVAQRLLGVRFGLVRMALGAALTLTVFSPIANALVGPTRARSRPLAYRVRALVEAGLSEGASHAR